jgi:hypothetical protein
LATDGAIISTILGNIVRNVGVGILTAQELRVRDAVYSGSSSYLLQPSSGLKSKPTNQHQVAGAKERFLGGFLVEWNGVHYK